MRDRDWVRQLHEQIDAEWVEICLAKARSPSWEGWIQMGYPELPNV